MLGILMVWTATGSLVFTEIAAGMAKLTAHPGYLTAAALLVFCGAVGKSAQFPLHVWLPDAMEGPTPVSALIHAATMVAAGVYMLVRVGFLIDASSGALQVIAWIGTITAVLAALMATQQNDIKRILAYSTLSQLGYMVMAVGLASGQAAMFHLFTHASFKALLFLGAGSIIYMLHHEQDIWRMGGLAKRLPITFLTFLVGTLALIGFPGFSGFFSKDAILALAYERNLPIFAVGRFHRFAHRLLHDAAGRGRVFRQRAQPARRPRRRISRCHDAPPHSPQCSGGDRRVWFFCPEFPQPA